jgi:sterol desaturase/sphingolipid hydroxylase (fatty acid hydroxylase superfamily)
VVFGVNNLAKLFYNIKKQRHLIYFIRKQKSFNKGRYSRNRQIYRTGTYWCFYVNIVAVLGLNFLFYKFTINFLQYWWFFFGCLFICVLVYFCRSSFQTYIALCCSIIEYMSKGDLVYFLIEWLPFETFESLRNSPMYPLMDFEDTIIDSWLDYI